jgi:guanylate kinase
MLLIVSGPSGVGKSALIEIARDKLHLAFVVPYTTRGRRATEEHGRDYWFLSRSDFQSRIPTNSSLTGITRWTPTMARDRSSAQLLRVPTSTCSMPSHGWAIRLRAHLPQTRLLFLATAERARLEHRLEERAYDERQRLLREAHWDEEAVHAPLFDRVVADATSLNRDAIEALISAEKDLLSAT